MSAIVTRAPAGENLPVLPGDFILTHGDHFTSKAIRVGQRLRYRGEDRKYTEFNHAALAIDPSRIVEALGRGVTLSSLDKYTSREYVRVRVRPFTYYTNVNEVEYSMRQNAVHFACGCVGQRYGFLTIACIGFGLLTGGKFTFGFDGQQICSGLVSRALERLGYVWPRNPAEMMPADLAYQFGVTYNT